MNDEISVMITDDHLLVRQGLKRLLSQKDNIVVIGEATNGEEAIEKVATLKPDILLLDINMPKMNGLEALKKIKKNMPNQKVIMLTIHSSKNYIDTCMKNKADGYMSKDSDIAVLVDAIKKVHNGNTYIEPTIFDKFTDIRKGQGFEDELDIYKDNEVNLREVLTSREYEVISKVADGNSNQEIAKLLGISEKTVKNHMYNIFKKLDIEQRTQAVILFLENK